MSDEKSNTPPDHAQRPEPSKIEKMVPDNRRLRKTILDRPSHGTGAPVSPPPPRKKK